MSENVVVNGTQYNGVDALALIRADGTVVTFYPDAVRYNEQTLTEAQKAQARENIGITGTGADGERGTGLLPITTAPSAYTTAVNGITPAYRIALSTVKTQSGVTEVLIGDTVRYSYYHYPVVYVDASYVYCGTRVSIQGADGKTAYQYAQDGGYTGTEAEFAAKLAGGASALQTFIDNTDVDYAYDAATGVNYTVIRVYRDKIDGTKQFPFVHHEPRKSTYDLVMEHGFCLAINAGVFNTTTGAADGIVIENGEVLQDGETATHPQCLPLTIDANGNLSYASYNASAVELAANGIVSAVTGFMPIIIDYQEYAQANWNSVAHYTENAQRQIIGQFGNGDYAIVTCEGRSHQNSDGWTIAEAQTVCKRLGLKFAYNLDGGGSTETMLGYKHLNTIYDGTTGRKVPTFIVFTGSTSIDVTPGEVPETYTEVEYVETSGDAYIRTDITEAETLFDYEAKILSTADATTITNHGKGNGHIFSSANTYYPFLRVGAGDGDVSHSDVVRKINGTENSSGIYTTFGANKWYVLSNTQSSGSNITTLFDVAANKSLYTSTKTNGTTYSASNTFCICAYGGDSGQKRLRFFGKLSYIKLSLNGELVHHFVAAKSNKTGVYGLLDKVTGVFHRSTSGTDFTGA